ncbi:MAG: ABC transporter permease [Thermoactinospora sp.]|nr:ABC transporter permease [Thermoactinospora sp.]
MSIWQRAWEGVLGLLALLGLVLVLTTSGDLLAGVLAQAGQLGLVAMGLGLSLRTGTPNLAVGALSGLSAALVAFTTEAGMPLPIAILLAFALAGLAGGVMSVFTMSLSAPAWAVSLGAAVVCEAFVFALLGGRTIPLPSGADYPGVLGFAVFAVVSVAGGLLWNRQEVREDLGAGRPGAVVGLAGSSLLAAAGGIALLMRLGATPTGDPGFYTTVFALAAVLLGGTSPYGRHAGVAGTVLGVLILAAAQGRLAYHGAPAWVFMLVMGAVMMIGLGASKLIDALRAGELSPGPS